MTKQEIRTLLDKTHQENPVMIAAHRGTSGANIIENTCEAYTVAMLGGTNIVEMDVARTTDGVLYVLHDGTELRMLNIRENIKTVSSAVIDEIGYVNANGAKTGFRVNRFEDVLAFLKGKDVLINVDRAWDIFPYVFEAIAKHDMWKQVIIKSPAKPEVLDQVKACPEPVMYMPIVRTEEDIALMAQYPEINMVAMEMVFLTEEDSFIQPDRIKAYHDQGLLLWGNVMRLSDNWNCSAWHDDNVALLGDPDKGWGWMADYGFDILQTDWPMFLSQYLRGRGMHK